jgi:hypothetical protein
VFNEEGYKRFASTRQWLKKYMRSNASIKG